MDYRSKRKRYVLLSPLRRQMGLELARGSYKGLINKCYDDADIRSIILNKIGRQLEKEMKKMCSKKVSSILRSNFSEALKSFKWADLLTELSNHAPVLVSILNACTQTKTFKQNRTATIGFCAAVLLKYRVREMSLVQKLIALIMRAGYCGKQVFYIHFHFELILHVYVH